MSAPSELFVDTSGWAEIADQSLVFHAQADSYATQTVASRKHLLTTDWILAELTALLTRPLRLSKPRQIQLLSDLRRDPTIDLIHLDQSLVDAAWQLWAARPDKDWTLVDCSSFVVMQQRGLTDALTTDHHFEQAGFIRLLK